MPEADTRVTEPPSEAQTGGMVVHADPTKEFFIEMLVRDISLIRAIIDLVDNSVDGARRTCPDGDYSDLWVKISVSQSAFVVEDNCGGIPLDVARNYAFRFGRPHGMPATPHSVGQFGVGMKRAFFKLGSHFAVQSGTQDTQFEIDEDVRKWRENPEWSFAFSSVRYEPSDIHGTKIRVTALHEGVRATFGLGTLHTELSAEIRDAHIDSLRAGLSIIYNDRRLRYEPLALLSAPDLEPAIFETTITDIPGSDSISVKAYVGLGESDPQQAGWSVFCNGRLILGANQTDVTGWGEGNGRTMPKYHNQFARFRGYVFFDCDDAGRLPWNTTKSGIDRDSTAYRSVRLQMISLMRPVINFLNQLDKEKDTPDDHKPLESAVDGMQRVSIQDVEGRRTFGYPRPPPRPRLPRTGRIQYSKSVKEIARVKKALRVRTYTDVGRCTFDYYFDRECT